MTRIMSYIEKQEKTIGKEEILTHICTSTKKGRSETLPYLIAESIGTCRMSLTLSSKRGAKEDGTMPLCIRFTIGTRRYYYNLGESYTPDDFAAICEAKKSTKPHDIKTKNDDLYEKKQELLGAFKAYVGVVSQLAQHNRLSIDIISAALTGKVSSTSNFITEWERVIGERSLATGDAYRIALNSFRELSGFLPKDGFLVNSGTISRWSKAMVAKGLSRTTQGIYMRACRVVLRECIRLGYIAPKDYPFSDRDSSLVSIPRGKDRKEQYLKIEQWVELYNFFLNKREKEVPVRYRYQTPLLHEALGWFLFSYLANGMNVADMAHLRYDEYYYLHEGKALRFERQKSRNRTDNNSEVIVPIIEPLKNIIDEIGAKPTPGGLVLPSLLAGVEGQVEQRKKVARENSNIADRLELITRYLGWPVHLTPTYCRHSFATNLTLQGVPIRYISESMGHSVSQSVTARYIADYPLELQMKFNNKLLHIEDVREKTAGEIIAGLSEKQKEELLSLLLAKKQ